MLTLQEKYIEVLSRCVTEARLSNLRNAIANRTRYLAVVLEDIYQSQNVSAVLRTCECVGIHEVHIIENRNKYTINPKVVMGATKWLSIHKYPSGKNATNLTLVRIKDQGYRVVVTTPHAEGKYLPNLNVEKGPIALVFGTELRGVSNDAMAIADEFLQIPMFGLTESYNLSVSAGICLYHLMESIRSNPVIMWEFGEEEKVNLFHTWLRLSVRSWKSIEKRVAEEWNRM